MSQHEPAEFNYSTTYLDIFGCNHSTKSLHSNKLICQSCGIFLNNVQNENTQPTTRVYKTLKMRYNAFFNPVTILSKIMTPHQVPPHQKCRLPIIDFLEQASERLNLSANTTFLAISYLDHFFSSVEVGDGQLFLYAATALMLAAKAQELDERIPFISKLKRYSSMTSHPEINNFSIQEFRVAEMTLIRSLDWKLQRFTLLDRIEALLSFGVIDDDDSLGQQQQKENKDQSQIHVKLRDLNESQILHYVKEVESKYVETAYTIIRGIFTHNQDDSIYFQHDQNILALACVAFLRKKAGLLNIWSQQLQSLTGESAQKISSAVSQILTLTPKVRPLKPIVSATSTTSSSYLYSANSFHTQTSMKSFPKKYQFEPNKPTVGDVILQYNTSKAQVKVPLFQSQSTVQLSKNDIMKPPTANQKYTSRNTNFTYLSDNIVHPNSYINLDKKYEQVHKVGETKFRTKIFN